MSYYFKKVDSTLLSKLMVPMKEMNNAV